jgi:protein-tyrosine phosphatase
MIPPFENSYWVLPNTLIAGQIPTSLEQEETELKLNRLIELNVKAVINLMEPKERNRQGELFYDYRQYLKNKNIQTHSFPVVDLSIPTTQTMSSVLNLIDDYRSKDQLVYIHCWGGIGRTGTVVGCYLKRIGLADNYNVFETIRSLKQYSGLANRLSPETEEQMNFVLQWGD